MELRRSREHGADLLCLARARTSKTPQHPMTERVFLDCLNASLAEWYRAGAGVVVAVSGGPDSVALLRGLAALTEGKAPLAVAHLNHKLRRRQSDGDEQFVAELAGQLGLPFVSARVDVAGLARRRRQSIETAARECRYEFLRHAAESSHAGFVALGHTADDQAETILHRIVRGTGLKGLGGMPARRKLGPNCELVRPLLNVRRCDVLTYLDAIAQPYCRDETNDDLNPTRNRLRHELLPLLEQRFNPRVREALLRLGRLSRETQQVVEAQAAELSANAEIEWASEEDGERANGRVDEFELLAPSSPLRIQPSGPDLQTPTSKGAASPVAKGCTLSTARLAGCSPHVLRVFLIRLWHDMGWGLRHVGFDELHRLAGLIQDGHETVTLPGNVVARRRGDRVELRRNAS